MGNTKREILFEKKTQNNNLFLKIIIYIYIYIIVDFIFEKEKKRFILCKKNQEIGENFKVNYRVLRKLMFLIVTSMELCDK